MVDKPEVTKDGHTAGPWVVELPTPSVEDGGPDFDSDDCRTDFCIRKGTALRRPDGSAPGTYYVQDLILLQEDCLPEDITPRFIADAHLIGAALDMFAALKVAEIVLAGCDMSGMSCGSELQQVRDAIAKASA